MENDTIEIKRIQTQAFSILLVEDDELVRERMSMVLEAAGYGVLSVGTCEEARATLRSIVLPLMIIDRQLPDGDGMGLIAEFRQRCAPNEVYVLLLTAKDAAGDVSQGLAAGADDYLSKRCSDEEIIDRLRTALRYVKLRTKS